MAVTGIIDRLRRPEYTGVNRCLPCTVTNVAIAATLSGGIAYAWVILIGSHWWFPAGSLFLISLGAIWLRGYLVPGTPQLTKRYFPDWLLAKFDKAPGPGAGTPGGIDAGQPSDPSPNGGSTTKHAPAAHGSVEGESEPDVESSPANDPAEIDPEMLLLNAHVVEPCAQEDDLCLTEEFRRGWRDRIRQIRDDETERDELARELDLDPDSLEIKEFDGAFVADSDQGRLGQWESRAALVADLAAARELPTWVEGWADQPVAARSQVLGGLRIFLDQCPVCEGPVTAGTETVESCCRSHEVVAATCEDCDARLLEVSHPGEEG